LSGWWWDLWRWTGCAWGERGRYVSDCGAAVGELAGGRLVSEEELEEGGEDVKHGLAVCEGCE